MILLLVALLIAAAPAQARERARGAPGEKADWASADKHGFGTAAQATSRVWFTLGRGGMTEAFYPDLGHPSARSLDFEVDGKPVTAGTVATAALTYTQTSKRKKHWRLRRTYVTDPRRATILVRVRFDAVDGKDHEVNLVYDPALYGSGNDDVGWTRGHALLAHDRRIASALLARPPLTRTSSGYKGHEDGLLLHSYDALRPGNVVQQAHTRLTGREQHRDLTIALTFADVASDALDAARASLDRGFDTTQAAYAKGWTDYRNTLFPIPAAALPVSAQYETSLLVLKAAEDKDVPGAFVASPTLPWGRTTYRRARARDLYEIATALLAAGDKAAANRAQVPAPCRRPQPADDRVGLAARAPQGRQGDRRRDHEAEPRPRCARRADCRARLRGGPHQARRVRQAGRSLAAQRRPLDHQGGHYVQASKLGTAFLELVRLGVKRADDPTVVRTLQLVDRRLRVGAYYHRFTGDTYGERRDGRPFDGDAHPSLGRAWPLISGERGEYELLAARPATTQLQALADAANDGGMLPEQVWDGRPPKGRRIGTGTTGATPLLWAHAQLVRLAWDAESHAVSDRPQVVAARYANATG